ncbi:MAG TPA: rhodanese-like domain-containing protein [Daejeonella sp.]|nr:rhodanese-like domain-containing protein [Daejeonella sp.]
MKTYLKLIVCAFLGLLSLGAQAQNFPGKPGSLAEKNTWTNSQLMDPADLAAILRNPKAAQPLIYNIGVVDDIKGAKHLGASSEKANLEKFRKVLQTLPKNTNLVVYCGCCPFDKCPNIRPAFKLLNEMGFSHARLLNLPVNLKTNWISKGYPMAEK